MKLAYETYLPVMNKRTELPPIILIHGMIENRKTWKNVAPYISHFTKRKIYAVDLRNHGETPWGEDLSFQSLIQDIAEFFSCHKISKAIVVGHSLGGIIAMSFALKWPEKVEMLILEDTYTKKLKPSPNGVIAQVLNTAKETLNLVPIGADITTARENIRNFAIDFVPDEFANTAKIENYAVEMIPISKKSDSISYDADLDGLLDMVSTNKIVHELEGVYAGDTLFICGDSSFYKISKDERVLQFFPKAIVKKVDDATHFIHFEQPEIFVNEVVNFINGCTKIKSKY